ncbi:DNA methyltransferase [Rhodobacterales bacterium HKCCE4037]|nr:DNA methyltransferase [Rhodobacterales bacterium HKCCE4037]
MADFEALRPSGGFDFIMADPPWSFDNFSAKGEAKNAKAHYDCMPIEAIMALPVSALAARDCVLWMWATHPMLPEAMQCIEAWGFSYKTGGVWVKRTVHGKDHFGTGYIFRSSSEPILIATRGKPVTPAKNIRSSIASYGVDLRPGDGWADTVVTIEAGAREHSRKPDEAFAAAEALMPDARRLELFSRQPRKGWSGWGDQADKFEGIVA